MKQRLNWFNWLTENMNENIKAGTSDWFNNIKTIVAGFVGTGQDDNNWLLTVDANILVAVQNGYVASIGIDNGVRLDGSSGAGLWLDFFLSLKKPGVTEEELIAKWGDAEQAGTNEGLIGAKGLGFGGSFGGNWLGVDWIYVNWMYTDMGFDDVALTVFGNLYHLSGDTICRTPYNCVNSFFDPRTKWLSSSPVGYFELPVYFFDAFGYAFTGH